jgi:hypothetical protein
MLHHLMNAPRPALTHPRPSMLAFGLLAALALSACAPAADSSTSALDAPAASPGQLSTQVRLDTEAMLAGMAHARARLGLQEDATP